MKKLTILLIISTIFLSGCLYPEERLTQNMIPYDEQLQSVQNAVNQYREASGGLLPIKDRDMETPIYQKYPVDFSKIAPRYIPEPPSSAFESGGVYQYVLVDVEENPTVKLIDVRLADDIRELKTRIMVYRRSNGYPPFGKVISDKVFMINYEKLGYENPPYTISPYSGNNLPLVIDHNGEIYIDYSIDLYRALQATNHTYKPGDDIRGILVQNSVFVPAFSLPYTVKNNEPVFIPH